MKAYIKYLNKKYDSFILVNQEEEYREVEIEELPFKEGFVAIYDYDNATDKVIGRYVERYKSEVELLREQVEANSKAVEDVVMGLQGKGDLND